MVQDAHTGITTVAILADDVGRGDHISLGGKDGGPDVDRCLEGVSHFSRLLQHRLDVVVVVLDPGILAEPVAPVKVGHVCAGVEETVAEFIPWNVLGEDDHVAASLVSVRLELDAEDDVASFGVSKDHGRKGGHVNSIFAFMREREREREHHTTAPPSFAQLVVL